MDDNTFTPFTNLTELTIVFVYISVAVLLSQRLAFLFCFVFFFFFLVVVVMVCAGLMESLEQKFSTSRKCKLFHLLTSTQAVNSSMPIESSWAVTTHHQLFQTFQTSIALIAANSYER
jgi:hypothetical protein